MKTKTNKYLLMKKLNALLVLIFITANLNSQPTKDSTKLITTVNKETDKLISKKDTVKTNPVTTEEKPETGVAVSPSSLRFNAKGGTSQTKTLKLTNDTKKAISFQISVQDFMFDPTTGKEKPADKNFKYSLSKYLTFSPALVELKPRDSRVISVTINLPVNDTNAFAMWSTLIIDQVFERKPLEVPNANKDKIGLGINTGMGFGVKVFQNPPNVKTKNVEIVKLKFEPPQAEKKLPASIKMKVKNVGDGIGYCLYYIELTNLTTGKQTKVRVKQFSILPGNEKELKFELGEEYTKGSYSALTVLDFGDTESVQSAEVNFKLE